MSKRPAPNAPSTNGSTGESPAAESITVVWMLFVVIALVCEVSLLAALAFVRANPEVKSIAALAGALYFSAVIAGLVTICLVPVVLKVRRAAPPLAITVFAVMVGAAPLVTVLVGLLR